MAARGVVSALSILVINCQTWVEPLIVMAAFRLNPGGVRWMWFRTPNPISGSRMMDGMCIGLTSANSIWVVTFDNRGWRKATTKRTQAASWPGYTRLVRLMNRGRDEPGHDTMALGVGEGASRTGAPCARGHLAAVCSANRRTLIFVPCLPICCRSNRRPLRVSSAAQEDCRGRNSFPTGQGRMYEA